jgi:hypothetical protein
LLEIKNELLTRNITCSEVDEYLYGTSVIEENDSCAFSEMTPATSEVVEISQKVVS